jgi:superfamily II DNA helicase RecQ
MSKLEVDLICIDEAHCLSLQSNSFRSSYFNLLRIIKNEFTPLTNNILALTGTAS